MGMSCWHWEVCSVAVHNASGDKSQWGGGGGSVFADDSRAPH